AGTLGGAAASLVRRRRRRVRRAPRVAFGESLAQRPGRAGGPGVRGEGGAEGRGARRAARRGQDHVASGAPALPADPGRFLHEGGDASGDDAGRAPASEGAREAGGPARRYSTVTDLARLRG